MSGLLIKDLAVIKRQKVWMLALIMVFLSYQSPGFVAAYGGILASSMTLATFTYDSHESGMAFLMTLPITRKTYVRSKYLISTLMLLGFSALALISGAGARLLIDGTYSLYDLGDALVSVIIIDALLTGIIIPAVFKWGPTKGQTMAVASMAAFAGAMIALFKLGFKVPELRPISYGVGLALVIVGSLAVKLVSYFISVRIMENKEL